MDTFKGNLSERISRAAIVGTSVSVRSGSMGVFVGMDIVGRYASQDIEISPHDARKLAAALVQNADDADAEIEADAAHDATITE